MANRLARRTNGLGAHPGLRHWASGRGAAGADRISGRGKSHPVLSENSIRFGIRVPTANSKRLTATANRSILAANERPLQVDLVRLDRTVPAAGCVGSREPYPSTSTQRVAAQIPKPVAVPER